MAACCRRYRASQQINAKKAKMLIQVWSREMSLLDSARQVVTASLMPLYDRFPGNRCVQLQPLAGLPYGLCCICVLKLNVLVHIQGGTI
ncbi:hypothetical protein BTO32_15060 [Marinobacter lutaoensis]|uniref:Uncharacterized protein n=1 Tax=Marinobacter lutaoensis TaxID=135739 RepID=A0A1V2DPS1_9GAMM|nr:hypothetical protein BTO32_15060 [Marinobacter lutaoensis]